MRWLGGTAAVGRSGVSRYGYTVFVHFLLFV